MTRFALTRTARYDFFEILDYIATDSIDSSFKVRERFEEVFELVGGNPAVGHKRPDLTSRPFRFFPVYSYLVVYLADTEPVEIVRILSATRDLKRLLD